ncbi:MAG: 16S rRNA (cytosine(1402)-N(4))-methyltransferase RsmH [Candidatus Levybacteria bacterium]|nr:16S rRNA (cytosine(1402)-N(4))-methyltransferase RsmH [Candidatus Levybacteria bacterium]
MSQFHVSVLLKEVVDALDVKPGRLYLDATLGGGGHAFEILKRGGKVLGIDWDEEALDFVRKKAEELKIELGKDIILAKGNFRDIVQISKENGLGKADAVLFDLGVSSHQIDNSNRGFSFQQEGPLDMRMSKDLAVKAADLINGLNKGELYELFTKLGEEHAARTISNAIISARGVKPIVTTLQLADIVAKSFGLRGEIKPYMRAKVNQKVFQALRIAVNDELNNLREALPSALEILGPKGRIVVVSFHSLEDRIVKWKFIEFAKKGLGTVLTKHPILPSQAEIDINRRSASAKLRIFEKN